MVVVVVGWGYSWEGMMIILPILIGLGGPLPHTHFLCRAEVGDDNTPPSPPTLEGDNSHPCCCGGGGTHLYMGCEEWESIITPHPHRGLDTLPHPRGEEPPHPFLRGGETHMYMELGVGGYDNILPHCRRVHIY